MVQQWSLYLGLLSVITLSNPCTSCLHTTIDAAATRHVEGRNLFLSCHCPDVPVGVPTRWHRDGHLIERGEATRFLDRLPDVRKLILVPAQINDTGNYSCSVGNATGNSVGIIVMKFLPPEVTLNETYYRGCEGKDLCVGVRVRHVTRLLLFLMFESAYVEHAMYAYNATRQSLVIRSLNASYSGEWSVHVSNGHGIASANFTVNVTECNAVTAMSVDVSMYLLLLLCYLMNEADSLVSIC
ncbi:uncharacterized protein LOC134177380 [Corticium candelabrum]|uniref:uncharacterized protein LOC134177380 n=1 Tax=Corticium candelabrum TaxID=121492 RepID=UPI002E267740|nr:uncharacterized protein LOC134177380 [Corticium candelabrum]